MDYHPIQGRVAILLVASSYENWDKPAEGFAPTGSLELFLNCLNIKKKKKKKKKNWCFSNRQFNLLNNSYCSIHRWLSL